jgi:hypothetical protein
MNGNKRFSTLTFLKLKFNLIFTNSCSHFSVQSLKRSFNLSLFVELDTVNPSITIK